MADCPRCLQCLMLILSLSASSSRCEPQSKWTEFAKTKPDNTQRMIRQWTRDSPRKTVTLMIDLDFTAFYGNDGNDLGLALQWMDKDPSVVEELYTKLINPELQTMYQSYVAMGREVKVVIYTRRPQVRCIGWLPLTIILMLLLRALKQSPLRFQTHSLIQVFNCVQILYYRDEFSEQTLPMRYDDDWHVEGQLLIPPTVRSSSDMIATYAGPELCEDVQFDVKCGLERLLAARNAIAYELGLQEPPTIVVTAGAKDVAATARDLHVEIETALLFDDNTELRKDPRAVVVERLHSLPPSRCAQVLEFMQRQLRAQDLEENLVDFLEQVPSEQRCIMRDPDTGELSWRMNAQDANPPHWPTPAPTAAFLFATPRSARLSRCKDEISMVKEAEEDAAGISDVSPCATPVLTSERLTLPERGLDLKALVHKAEHLRLRSPSRLDMQ